MANYLYNEPRTALRIRLSNRLIAALDSAVSQGDSESRTAYIEQVLRQSLGLPPISQRYEVIAHGIGDAIGEPFELGKVLQRDTGTLMLDDGNGGVALTYHDRTFTARDVPGVEIAAHAREVPADAVERMRAAGWTVRVHADCPWCGESLPNPEDRSVTMHPECAAEQAQLKGVKWDGVYRVWPGVPPANADTEE